MYYEYEVNQLIYWLQGLIPLVIGARIVMCLIAMSADEEGDQRPMYKRRIKNALVFLIIAECSIGLITVLYEYFT